MMSRRAGDKRQGSLQGVMASVRAVAAIGAPVVMTGVFSWFTEDDTAIYLPGAPFYLAAVLALGCVAILVTTPRAGA
jgi:DHA1 family tetracycline resistance protein-like MFS transporter